MNEKSIGETIRECRLKKGYTQDALAQVINVSPQAISKWETGQTMPDITLLLPLSRMLEIGVDQLLGGNRRQELEERFLKTIPLGHELTLLVSLDALKEFPDDETFLYRRAYDEFFIGKESKGMRDLYLNRAAAHFRELCQKYPEHHSYTSMLAQTYLAQGSRDQALSAAYSYTGADKEHLMDQFLDDETKIAKQQRSIERHTVQLYSVLRAYGTREALAAAHALLDTVMGEDQDLLHVSMLWALYVEEAILCRDEGDTEGFVSYLTKAYETARAHDALPREVIPYRAPLLDRLQYDRGAEREVVSEVSQFIAVHYDLLAHPSAEELRRRIIEENAECMPLFHHLWRDHFQFCQRHINTDTYFNFSTGWDMTEDELDAMGNTLSRNPRYPGNCHAELMDINRSEVERLYTQRIMTGYYARLKENIMGFCNCGNKKKYKYLGISEEERAIPTAPEGAKILAIVEMLIANSFKNGGLEEKLLAYVCEHAKKRGYTHAEVYPLERMSLDKGEFEALLACYDKAGFTVIRDLSNERDGRYFIMQKVL